MSTTPTEAVIRGFRIRGFPSRNALVRAVDGTSTILMALNAEKLANADGRLQRLSREITAYADGYGAVLAMRRRGARSARIAGADLWLALVRAYAGRRRFYLVGSTADVVGEVVARLRQSEPTIDVAGYRDGYVSTDDERVLAADLVATRPQIVFVAMGSPRQELLMERLRRAHPAVYVGLGGSFDMFVGRRRRAPRLVQRLGVEWAYRFFAEPKRLPRLPAYLKFAWLLALNRL